MSFDHHVIGPPEYLKYIEDEGRITMSFLHNIVEWYYCVLESYVRICSDHKLKLRVRVGVQMVVVSRVLGYGGECLFFPMEVTA